jgi:LacI family transcriptional regulator
MAGAGLELDADHIRRGSFAPSFAKHAALEIVRRKNGPTALFASSDYLALGALEGMREQGISIPGALSFVSFDDAALWSLLTPAITAIRQPIELLGRQGFQALFALMTQKPAMRMIRLPVELIERESVAAPRARGQLI